MLLYKVTAKIHKSQAGQFAKYISDYSRAALKTQGFNEARLYKIKSPPEETEKIYWQIDYDVSSDDALKVFLAELSQELNAQALEKFDSQLQFETNVIEKVERVLPQKSLDEAPMSDFPKVHCPYLRQTFPIDKQMWKKYGSALNLRKPEVYLVVDKINPGYEWVFDDPDTFAVEKLHGTNVKVLMENGRIIAIQNRKNIIDPLMVAKGGAFITEGIYNSASRGWVPENGEFAGEVIGPKLQGNPYKLESHEWFPFDKTQQELRYRTFEENPRTFENLELWFKNHLHSRLVLKRSRKEGTELKIFAEGVIFYNLRRKAQKQTWMAKLRRDMYPWYYAPIEVPNFDRSGNNGGVQPDDQEQFE